MSEPVKCIVCDGAVVPDLGFRWDGKSQHTQMVDCIEHLKWKSKQADSEIATLRATLADATLQIGYLHETMQVREATLARVTAERDELRSKNDGLRAALDLAE